MKPDQNPFSLYDFLGYFIPGATVIFLIRILDQSLIDFDLSKFASKVSLRDSNLFFPFIIASYLTGHLFSIVSSYTIEKFANWSNTYPSAYLLKDQKKDPEKDWMQIYFAEKEEITKHELFKRSILILILLPMLIINYLFHKVFDFRYSTYKPFSADTIKHINNRKNKLLSELGVIVSDEKNNEEFLFIYHYVLENNNAHSKKIQNFVALFGFVRCIALIFNLTSWWLIYKNICIALNPQFQLTFDFHMLVLTVGSMLVSYFFYVAFLKFYKKFAQETLMVFAVIPLNNNTEKEVEI